MLRPHVVISQRGIVRHKFTACIYDLFNYFDVTSYTVHWFIDYSHYPELLVLVSVSFLEIAAVSVLTFILFVYFSGTTTTQFCTRRVVIT